MSRRSRPGALARRLLDLLRLALLVAAPITLAVGPRERSLRLFLIGRLAADAAGALAGVAVLLAWDGSGARDRGSTRARARVRTLRPARLRR